MPEPESVDPREILMRCVYSGLVTHALSVAIEWRLADAVGDRGASTSELAEHCEVPREQLVRLLRALAGAGLLAEEVPGRFTLTEAGDLLREERSGSLRTLAQVLIRPEMQQAWSHLGDGLRSGRTPFDEVFGMPFYEHLAAHPQLASAFAAAMSDDTHGVATTLPECYDFGRFRWVVDIGGGDATLLIAVLAQCPQLTGTVLDSAEAATLAAKRAITAADVDDRCTVLLDDFATGIPAGADAYLLKSVLHGRNDESIVALLSRCRDALPADGRILVIEPVLPATASRDGLSGYLSDLNMLAMTGGRERTRADYEQLGADAGLVVGDVVALPAGTGYHLVEFVPATT